MGLIHLSTKDVDRYREFLKKIKKKDKEMSPDDIAEALREFNLNPDDERGFDILLAFTLGAVANETRSHDWYQFMVTLK